MLIKDQIASKDKLKNSAGSFAFDGSQISEDSFLVQKLRNAGVVILGKNSMSEFAGLRSVTPPTVSGGYPQGWCAKGGQGMISSSCLVAHRPNYDKVSLATRITCSQGEALQVQQWPLPWGLHSLPLVRVREDQSLSQLDATM